VLVAGRGVGPRSPEVMSLSGSPDRLHGVVARSAEEVSAYGVELMTRWISSTGLRADFCRLLRGKRSKCLTGEKEDEAVLGSCEES